MGLSNQITNRLLSGEDISSSFKNSISSSTQAKIVGLKEKFDPLNMVKLLTGGSTLAPALLGKMTGRSQEDIGYFAGSKKNRSAVKDPLYLYTVKRNVENIRVNETLADALGKLYTLFKKIDDDDKLRTQIRKDFEQERIEEEQRRNDEILKAIKRIARKAKTIKDKEEKVKRQKEKEESEKRVEKPGFIERVTETATRVVSSVPGKVAIGAGLGLFPLLVRGEAKSYNTLYGGREIDLVNMTVDEVLQYQRGMGVSSAVGKYQIIRSTLTEAKKALKLSGNEKFDQQLQDRIYSEFLIGSKRRAVDDYINGRSDDLPAAQLALAQEFASFGVPYAITNNKGLTVHKGESYYKGQAGNKASITPEQSAKALQEEREARLSGKTTMASTETNQPISNPVTHTDTNNNQTVVMPTVAPTPTKVSTTMSDNEPTTMKVNRGVPVSTPNNRGNYVSNISSENRDIKKNILNRRQTSVLNTNLNVSYQPGDILNYYMDDNISDDPKILRR
jgi:hypothetical protein